MDNTPALLAGADYGSKLAGTTAVVVLEGTTVALHQSLKKQDADVFLTGLLQQYRPTVVGFDAPLSLPGVYRGLKDKNDYFYRVADRELNCMSPMFLGGLTARAIQLTKQPQLAGINFIETYPAKICRDLGFYGAGYKKDLLTIATGIKLLTAKTGWQVPTLTSWHAFDALLALYGAYKFARGTAQAAGDAAEGLIYY